MYKVFAPAYDSSSLLSSLERLESKCKPAAKKRKVTEKKTPLAKSMNIKIQRF